MELQSRWKMHESYGNDEKETTTRIAQLNPGNMKTPIEYTIVAVPFHADAATHEELARKVNEKLNGGYELFGSPFFSEEMMYQAMTRPMPQTAQSPAT
jgi:hypothetical protein